MIDPCNGDVIMPSKSTDNVKYSSFFLADAFRLPLMDSAMFDWLVSFLSEL